MANGAAAAYTAYIPYGRRISPCFGHRSEALPVLDGKYVTRHGQSSVQAWNITYTDTFTDCNQKVIF